MLTVNGSEGGSEEYLISASKSWQNKRKIHEPSFISPSFKKYHLFGEKMASFGLKEKQRQNLLLQHSDLSRVELCGEMHVAKSRAVAPWDGPSHEPWAFLNIPRLPHIYLHSPHWPISQTSPWAGWGATNIKSCWGIHRHWGTCLGKAKHSLWAEACLTMADQRGFLHLKWWPDYAVYHFQVTDWRKKRHKAHVSPQCAAEPPISRLRSCLKPEPSFIPNWAEDLILNF